MTSGGERERGAVLVAASARERIPLAHARSYGLWPIVLAVLATLATSRAAERHASLVIVIDGLRPDYITNEIMPNLLALGETGVMADAHHAVFPTVTRVNASSISTGAYPRTHGLMHNTIYLAEASPDPIDTGEAPALLAAETATHGRLLTAVTAGELLAQAGRKVLVVGSGSSGSSLLLNHKMAGGAPILNSRKFIRPESLRQRVESLLGTSPENAYPNTAAVRWSVNAYLDIGLKELRPDVTFMWLTDPDGTAHRHGVGTPIVLEALRNVDRELGRILTSLTERGLRERVNIFVTADHGFSTHGGPFNLGALLAARGLAEGVKIVGGTQLYVRSGGEERIARIVRVLQETPWVGAIFTRAKAAGSAEGFVAGTLSLEAIHYQHGRAADILVDPNWTHGANAQGYAGTTSSGGVAGHGSSSPYDIRIRLTAAGPDVKRATRSTVPTGNIDLAVTLCHLHGVKPAPSMAGRVLSELLREGPAVESVRVEHSVDRVGADTANGRYDVELHKARVGPTEYVSYTQTTRR